MKRKIIVVILIILTVILIISLTNSKSVENIVENQFNYNNLNKVELSEVDLTRYNEKISIHKIAESIINLEMLLDNGNLSLDGIVKYAIYYSEKFDYKFGENSYIDKENLYVKKSYITKIVKNLFNVDIDFNDFTELGSRGDYVILSEYYYIKLTDVQLLSIEKLQYDLEKEQYVIYINYINSIDMNLNNEGYDLNNIEEELIEKTICIRYIKEKSSYMILDYFEVKG